MKNKKSYIPKGKGCAKKNKGKCRRRKGSTLNSLTECLCGATAGALGCTSFSTSSGVGRWENMRKWFWHIFRYSTRHVWNIVLYFIYYLNICWTTTGIRVRNTILFSVYTNIYILYNIDQPASQHFSKIYYILCWNVCIGHWQGALYFLYFYFSYGNKIYMVGGKVHYSALANALYVAYWQSKIAHP